LTEAETTPVRARMEELWNGHHDYGWPHRHLQTWDPEDKDTPGGNYRSGSLQQPAAIESVFDDFTGNPKLVGAMEALLDGPVKRYTDQTIFKPGVYKAGRSFYHQDAAAGRRAELRGRHVHELRRVPGARPGRGDPGQLLPRARAVRGQGPGRRQARPQ
jgi:hypothetical protein